MSVPEAPQSGTGAVPRMDRIVYSFARHWLAIFNLIVMLYVGLPFVAPVLMHFGLTTPAGIIYKVYYPLCHQYAFRSWWLFGEKVAYTRQEVDQILGMDTLTTAGQFVAKDFLGNEQVGYKVAFCQRDVAIYGGLLLGALIFGAVRGRSVRPVHWLVWLLIGVVPVGLDGLSQLFSEIPGVCRLGEPHVQRGQHILAREHSAAAHVDRRVVRLHAGVADIPVHRRLHARHAHAVAEAVRMALVGAHPPPTARGAGGVRPSHPDSPPFTRFASFSGIDGLMHALFTRHGGVSAPPFDTLNMSRAVEDEPDAGDREPPARAGRGRLVARAHCLDLAGARHGRMACARAGDRRGGAAQMRHPHHGHAGPGVVHALCGLHAGADRRPAAARRGVGARGLARHAGGLGRTRGAGARRSIREPAGGPARRDRPRDRAVLLRGRPRRARVRARRTATILN